MTTCFLYFDVAIQFESDMFISSSAYSHSKWEDELIIRRYIERCGANVRFLAHITLIDEVLRPLILIDTWKLITLAIRWHSKISKQKDAVRTIQNISFSLNWRLTSIWIHFITLQHVVKIIRGYRKVDNRNEWKLFRRLVWSEGKSCRWLLATVRVVLSLQHIGLYTKSNGVHGHYSAIGYKITFYSLPAVMW